MFKKVLPILAFFGFAVAAGAQSVKFNENRVHDVWMPSSDFTDLHIGMTNNSGATADLVLAQLSIDWPSQWSVSFCDDQTCYASFQVLDTFDGVKNGGNTEFKVSVFPMGHADTGTFTYVLYSASNPTDKDTITVNVYVPWGAGLASVQKQSELTVYPNPANGYTSIIAASTGVVDVVSASGAVVYSAPVVAGVNSADLSAVSPGTYMVRVTSTAGVSQTRLIKN